MGGTHGSVLKTVIIIKKGQQRTFFRVYFKFTSIHTGSRRVDLSFNRPPQTRKPVVGGTLRMMLPQQCFLICAGKKHLLRQQNVSEKVEKYILLLERSKKKTKQTKKKTKQKKLFPQQSGYSMT